MKNKHLILIAAMTFVPILRCHGQAPGEDTRNPYAVTTFECAGLYWKQKNNGDCKVRYRQAREGSWKEGLDLVYDARDGEYRGSIVGLVPGTEYQIELSTPAGKVQLKCTTRDENFPVGKTTLLTAGESDQPVVITESGTPGAYHLVTIPEKSRSVLNLKNVYDYGIEIDADYVIVRGIEINNAAIHGILIKQDRHDILVEKCHITFWGRIGGPRTFGNNEGGMDSGIWVEEGSYNITIQRNLIENPRGASNDWETGHPSGPQGITFIQSRGGNVIRYNDILSTEDHGYNDGIGGSRNFSWEGNLNRDSDIHGNIIRNVWDDAIECEGGNTNVRIWGNYAFLYFNAIATASTSKGPLYIYRNVLGESRRGHSNNLGGAVIKTGERDEFGGGRRYVFHNTALQPNGPNDGFTGHVNPNCISRNNIFDVPGRLTTDREKEPQSDYDYDYFSGNHPGSAKEPNGIKFRTTPSGTSLYVYSFGLEFYPKLWINSIVWGKQPITYGDRTMIVTDPVGQMKNPLIDAGVPLPGFNDDFVGEAPDLGAFETGAPPLEFGRRAYLDFRESWAPWEIF